MKSFSYLIEINFIGYNKWYLNDVLRSLKKVIKIKLFNFNKLFFLNYLKSPENNVEKLDSLILKKFNSFSFYLFKINKKIFVKKYLKCTVLRSPHIFKSSREQFSKLIYCYNLSFKISNIIPKFIQQQVFFKIFNFFSNLILNGIEIKIKIKNKIKIFL